MIDGYHVPFRIDRNDRGGGSYYYIFGNIFHVKKIIVDFDPLIEVIALK